ncbi:MAG TPA: type I restriction-modification system endonuclease [Pantanalinema sp.]
MSDSTTTVQSNFSFLAEHSPRLVTTATLAERYLADDPNTCLIKLRQYAEILAQMVAARIGLYTSTEDSFKDILDRMRDRNVLAPDVANLFHGIRKAGNGAAHSLRGEYDEALHQLRMARALAVWFHQAFGKERAFKPEPFRLPARPADGARELAEQIERLQQELAATREASTAAQDTAREEALRRLEAEARAQHVALEREQLEAAAKQAEEQFQAERQRLTLELEAVQAKAASSPAEAISQLVAQAVEAGQHLDIDEADTRRLIDQQLREAGWEVDTQNLTYAKGVRPQKGKNLAIAEWPTESGPADYVLFAGLLPLGVVEAKRRNKDVAAYIRQAKRYSKTYKPSAGEAAPGGPWGEYKIPFLYSTNGRPFLRQLKEKSGVWFLDARRAQNHPYPLEAWYTPQGLLGLLEQDVDRSNEALASEAFSYLDLRDYQKEAIRAVEQAIIQGQREMLVAMATGTGKTRTCIGLIYRLAKAKRFRRVLFLVDRSALGEQTLNAFKDVRLENLQTFSDIYDVKGMGDMVPDADTRLHIATVQGMVKRILYPSTEDRPFPVDLYDCIVIDECHRGYNLDKDLSETELTFRSEEDYFSKYRRVLDHFDAVKIGLTATPALHTTEIFGAPVYQYSYRQAVIDGYLVDHEPPIRIVTGLAEDGIVWKVGEPIPVYNVRLNTVDLLQAPDEVALEVDAFNRKVVTENFNRVVCRELARHIDPSLPGKTLLFCATDSHADLVVRLLKEAYEEQHGGIDDDAIVKITGSADDPLGLIRRFKNEQHPKVVVTVDLLTTGIDVPEIVNLVFIRLVRSRILYEQMLGRATRLCDDIGKDRFRIFDAVDLYKALAPVSTMKPVVTTPTITFEQLVEELKSVTHAQAQQEVHDQLLAKLQRKAKRLKGHEGFETLAGMNPAALIAHLRSQGPAGSSTWFKTHQDLALFLDRVRTGDGPTLLISHHEDELRRVERGYGNATRPEDYLESFTAFIRDNMNLIPALSIVTQRPRDLTRAQLKELKLALDQAGYNEAALQTAWQEMTNEDIAASIIGFIRQRALGSPLVPYAERVERAVKKIVASRYWTEPQRKWLERIGSQLKQETIVDREALDRGQFKASGGFARIDKMFEGQLEMILGDLQEQVWKDAG